MPGHRLLRPEPAAFPHARFEHPIHRARWSTAERDGWVVVPLTKSACTPENWTGHGKTECHDWYVWAVARAKALRLDVMLMTVSSKHFADRQPEVLEPPS